MKFQDFYQRQDKFSFVPVAIDEWNSLPMGIRQSINLYSFKNSIQMSKSVPPSYFYGERY
jgi:hypothetical protein